MQRENSENDAAKKKKPYVKPQVTQVPLRPEEAVLGFCKNGSTAGPMAGNCTAGGCPTGGS